MNNSFHRCEVGWNPDLIPPGPVLLSIVLFGSWTGKLCLFKHCSASHLPQLRTKSGFFSTTLEKLALPAYLAQFSGKIALESLDSVMRNYLQCPESGQSFHPCIPLPNFFLLFIMFSHEQCLVPSCHPLTFTSPHGLEVQAIRLAASTVLPLYLLLVFVRHGPLC